MVLKGVLSAVMGAALMVAAGAVWAAGDGPDQFFNLDLSKALLSPKPLGPSSEFTPGAAEAESGHSGVLSESDAKKVAVERVKGAQARVEPQPTPHRKTRLTHARAKPRGTARVRLARRQGNPLNAQARDTRIQTWPCNPDYGGICNWRR